MTENTNNVRLAAANMLLDRGIRYTISDTPLLGRLLRLNKIKIHPLKAGTLIEISRIISENKLDKIEESQEAIIKLRYIVSIIAVAILNNKILIKYCTRFLTNLMIWKIPIRALLGIFYQILQVNKLSDFMNITIYFEHQAQMMMNPKNLGQR